MCPTQDQMQGCTPTNHSTVFQSTARYTAANRTSSIAVGGVRARPQHGQEDVLEGQHNKRHGSGHVEGHKEVHDMADAEAVHLHTAVR